MIFDPFHSTRLTGRHAELYRRSLGQMLDLFRDCFASGQSNLHWTFGVSLFDALDWWTKLTTLQQVSSCVLEGSGDVDEWCETQKAAFYVVYRHVFQQLEIERDMRHFDSTRQKKWTFQSAEAIPTDQEDWDDSWDDHRTGWEGLIVQAYREECQREGVAPTELVDVLEEGCGDDELTPWQHLLERLADVVLEDRDFELIDVIPESQPPQNDTKEQASAMTLPGAETMGSEIGLDGEEPEPDFIYLLFGRLAELARVEHLSDSDYPSF